MNAPNPVPTGVVPSNSTTASAAGGSLAAIIIYILSFKGITFPAGMEAALAVVISTLAGYLPASGRK